MYFSFLIYLFFSLSGDCLANFTEASINRAATKKLDMTKYVRNAITKYEVVNERLDYFGDRLVNLAPAEYVSTIGYVAPIMMGQLSFELFDLNFRLDYKEQKGNVQYVYHF